MSYDLEIRGDDKYSSQTNLGALSAFISGLPDVELLQERYFRYKTPHLEMYMEVDLEFVDERGDVLDMDRLEISLANKDSVNCIRLHIPYAFMHDDYQDQLYIAIGQKIAHYLGWRLYDYQSGAYYDG